MFLQYYERSGSAFSRQVDDWMMSFYRFRCDSCVMLHLDAITTDEVKTRCKVGHG